MSWWNDTTLRRVPRFDPLRHHVHRFGSVTRPVALPVTFTPYAAAQPCSARCRFCSETLVPQHARGPLASTLRPHARYGEQLARCLELLAGLPVGLSLSGLEATDHPEWLLGALEHLDRFPFEERVLYSNAAGLCDATQGQRLRPALEHFDRIEISRHSHNPERNRAIMRFRSGQPIADGAVFEDTVRAIKNPIRLVCVVQRGGVEDATSLRDYLRWARDTLGVRDVVLRELAQLGDLYRSNATQRYIEQHRVPFTTLLAASEPWVAEGELQPVERTDGYYFWNARAKLGDMLVTFEASNYATMRERHSSNAVHKLIFHANGNLTGDWDPNREIIARIPPSSTNAPHLTVLESQLPCAKA